MKTIIAGGRNVTSYNLVVDAMKDCGWTPSEVFTGRARGADTLGEIWAKRNNIKVAPFPANWDRDGRAAGYIRNMEMLDAGAEALVALWDGQSRGTKHMIEKARERGLKVFVFRV